MGYAWRFQAFSGAFGGIEVDREALRGAGGCEEEGEKEGLEEGARGARGGCGGPLLLFLEFFWIFQLCCFCWVLGFFVILQANTFGFFCQLDSDRR